MKPRIRADTPAIRVGWVAFMVLAFGWALTLLSPAMTAGDDLIVGEVVIKTTGLSPEVLVTEPARRVRFVNRTGRPIHLDFVIRNPERHHLFHVQADIWAIFHRPGLHEYEVHFGDPTLTDHLRGVVEVVADPDGGRDPLVCSGITVQGGCIER